MEISRRNYQGASAFTLLELMVVLVVIAIMTAMVIPEMKGTFEDAVLRSTARKLMDVCGLAHSRAVTRNEPHAIRIDQTRGRYVIEVKQRGKYVALTDVAGAEGPLDRRVSIDLRRNDEAEESVEVTAVTDDVRSDAIVFYPDGTAEQAIIILRDREGFELVLAVNPTTGRIQATETARR